ncbi:MAG: hypothetical protein H6857_03215 [Rhodospirillales bacterium]|nr:hypothetical protein [Rhodospirillales bacterium]
MSADRVQISKGAGTAAGDYSIVKKSITVSTGEKTSISLYIKSNTGSPQKVMLYQNDHISISAISVIAGTEWVRYDIKKTSGNTIASFNLGLFGDDGTGVTSSDVLIWGAQLEVGAFPTSYIPTTSAAATRAVDSFLMPAGLWLNTNYGTFYAYFDGGRESNQGTYGRVISPLGSFTIIACDAGSTSRAGTWSGGSPLTQESGQDYYTTAGSAAMSYNQIMMNRSLSTRGQGAVSGTYSNPYSFGVFGIGRNSGSATNILNGHIKNLKYYPARVSDTQLQLLTQ